jgi:RHS repeat-associated protein
LERHGSVRTRRIDVGGIDGSVAEIRESSVVGIFRDGTGNVTATSLGASLTFRRSFEAFGSERNATEASVSERGYASLVEEGQSTLLYARARIYDPRFGRFLQADPLGIETDQLYAYAGRGVSGSIQPVERRSRPESCGKEKRRILPVG